MQKQPFPVRGEGVKSLRTGGLKKFRAGGRVTFNAGGRGSQYPITCHVPIKKMQGMAILSIQRYI